MNHFPIVIPLVAEVVPLQVVLPLLAVHLAAVVPLHHPRVLHPALKVVVLKMWMPITLESVIV